MKIRLIKIWRALVMFFLFTLFGFGALYVRYVMFRGKKTLEQYETLQGSWAFFVRLIQKTGMITIKSDDLERIKNLKNSIIVSTHPSFIDIVILMSIIPHSTCFVAERLANNPFFRGMVKLLFIIEGQSTDNLLKEAKSKLDDGMNIIIFPMGIRHRKNEYPKIRRGASLLALHSRKNIELIGIETSYDFLQINQPIYKAGAEPAIFDINYLGQIDIKKYLEEYPDEVEFKTAVTRKISEILYRK